MQLQNDWTSHFSHAHTSTRDWVLVESDQDLEHWMFEFELKTKQPNCSKHIRVATDDVNDKTVMEEAGTPLCFKHEYMWQNKYSCFENLICVQITVVHWYCEYSLCVCTCTCVCVHSCLTVNVSLMLDLLAVCTPYSCKEGTSRRGAASGGLLVRGSGQRLCLTSRRNHWKCYFSWFWLVIKSKFLLIGVYQVTFYISQLYFTFNRNPTTATV